MLLESQNRIPAFLHGIMRPRGRPPCRNAAIRDGPGANKPCCQSIWGSLAAFFVISSLFSLLASLAAARPGKVQTLLQYSCSSVVHYFYKGLPASLCALPSSLLGPDPFLYHPALLGPNHLSSLFSLLFSLFSRCCSFPRSHFATATSICASGHRLRAKLLRPFAAPMQTRESANPVAVQLQCSCSLFLQGFDGGCSSRPPPPPQQTLWGPLAASWVVLRFPRWLFCLSWAEPESIVSFAAVAVCGAFSVLLSWNLA